MIKDQNTLAAIACGVLLSLYRILHSEDFIKTIILATASAAVSYMVSYMLRAITKRINKD